METEYFLESIRNNITGYILKPIDFEQLIETLYKTAEMVNVRKENEAYKTKLQEMVEEKTVALERSYEKMHEFLTIDKVTKLQNATMLYHYLDNFFILIFRLKVYLPLLTNVSFPVLKIEPMDWPTLWGDSGNVYGEDKSKEDMCIFEY